MHGTKDLCELCEFRVLCVSVFGFRDLRAFVAFVTNRRWSER
jgi:hypothetical protein